MTQQENILSKQIKGLTWGVVFAIVGTFGGGAVFIVRQLIVLEKAMTRYDGMQAQIDDVKTSVRVVNIRVDNQEGRIFDLANKIEAK